MPWSPTRVQLNVLANLAGQSGSAVLALVCVPWLVRLLGLEAFGIVAFHMAICAAFGLIDLGLSTAINRQLARLSGVPDTENWMRETVHAVGRIYWLIVALISLTLFLLAPLLAQDWFRLEQLDPTELTLAIRLMAVAVFLQWPAAFYSACLAGLQHQTRLNVINLTVAVVRFPGAILLLVWSPSLTVYFVVQALAGVLHTGLTFWSVRRALPRGENETPPDSKEREPMWQFAAGISGIAVLSLVQTQADRVVLSALLPLDQFGGYMLAATIAGGIAIVGGAIYSAALPRLSELVAKGDEQNVRAFYHDAAQLLGTLLFPISAVLVIFAEAVVRVWTGNAELALAIAPQVRFLVAGTALMWVYSVPCALQFAHGWTRLAFMLNAVTVFVQVPLLWVLARCSGGDGAAMVWLLIGVAYILVGPPVMHRYLLRGELFRWCAADLLLPALPAFAVCGMFLLVPLPTERLSLGLVLMLAGLATALTTLCCVPLTRQWACRLLQRSR